jgi:hypothetical protein
MGDEEGRPIRLEAKPAEPRGLALVQEVEAGALRLRRLEGSGVSVPDVYGNPI